LHQDLEVVLANAMLPPVYPVRLDELGSMRVIRNIAESEMIVLSEPDAPPQVCNVYRERETCSPQGWGHSTWEMAVEIAQAAGAKKLVLTHHNVHHDDAFMENMERQAQAHFPAAIVAREGLTLNADE